MTTTVPLKRIARFAYGDSLATEDREEGDVPVFGSNGQVGSHTQSNTGQPVVIVGRKGSFGKVQYSDEPVFAIDTTYYIDRTQTSSDIRWLYYVLLATDLGAFSADTGVPGLSRESAYQRLVRWVPVDQQRLIADFLDRETHRLDALVDTKRRMIGLLEEKREALLTRVLTSGLSESFERKTTGLNWLPRIPVHWSLIQLRRVLTSIVDGPFGSAFSSDDYSTEGAAIVRLGNIGKAQYHAADQAYIPLSLAKKFERHSVSQGDLLMAGLGHEDNHAGRACVAPDLGPAIVKGKCFRLRPDPNAIVPDFLAAFLSSAINAAQVSFDAQGSTRKMINLSIAKNLYVPYPPLADQRRIAGVIHRNQATIDTAIGALQSQLDLLAEYRQALITQAVTGQLDEATLKGDRPVGEAVGVIPE